MPGLVAYAERIILRITNIQVAQVRQAFKFIGLGKFLGEILRTEISFTHVKIAYRVVRAPWWCERIRSQ